MANRIFAFASNAYHRPLAGGAFHIPNSAALEITADLKQRGFTPCAISWTVPRLNLLKQRSAQNYQAWMDLLGRIHSGFTFPFSLRLPRLHIIEDMLTRPDILERLVPKLKKSPHLNPNTQALDLNAHMYRVFCAMRDNGTP